MIYSFNKREICQIYDGIKCALNYGELPEIVPNVDELHRTGQQYWDEYIRKLLAGQQDLLIAYEALQSSCPNEPVILQTCEQHLLKLSEFTRCLANTSFAQVRPATMSNILRKGRLAIA